MEKGKSRSAYWDNLKGVLILLTVFAHILLEHQSHAVTDGLYDLIYMFHMPAFAFVSGYFGKSEHAASAPALIRLGVLYFLCNSVFCFFYGLGALLTPMYSCWFLLSLIVWRLTARQIAGFKHIRLFLLAAAVLAGFYGSIDNTLAAARTLCFYPFYMTGFLLTQEEAQKWIRLRPAGRRLWAAVCLLAALALALSARQWFRYDDQAFSMSGYGSARDALGRILLFAVAFLMIAFLRLAVPDRKLPLLTKFGKNSLWIFLFHRPVTLLISGRLELTDRVPVLLCAAAAGTLAICLVFGNDFLAPVLNRFADALTEVFTNHRSKALSVHLARLLLAAVAGVYFLPAAAMAFSGFGTDLESLGNREEEILYPVMSDAQKQNFDRAFRITFAGDLILLEDQVKRAYTENGYDFSSVFEYAEPYISSADYAIGVLEGPLAGEEAGYTTGNFDDGKTLALNFPDSFASAVKNAGFDLVTTANNHVLDRGPDGAKRTLDVLDQIGLDHTGSYRDREEKNRSRVKLAEADGIRMAILSYTFGSNYYTAQELAEGELSYVTSLAAGTGGRLFEQLKASVIQDFADAKALEPDLIIVLPHMGTQFRNAPDAEQKKWFGLFKQLGADIILGDHPHVVQPTQLEEYDGRTVFTAYCPGNFANKYRNNQGDTSMLIDVYIDRTSKEVIGGAIVPLYTQSQIDGNYRALPVYEIVSDQELRRTLSTDDYDRAADANKLATKVVFGHEMDPSSMTERYYFDGSGFLRSKTTGLALDDPMKSGTLFQALGRTDSVCFIGDSVTEGTKNGGCPWYEPLEEYLNGKTIQNVSKGGCTVSYMLERVSQIPAAGLYVIALGTNDVRYRDAGTCAMTAERYIQQLDSLKTALSEQYGPAEFIFIAPWYSTDGDTVSRLSFAEKTAMNEEYSEALRRYCEKNGLGYINANPYIREALTKRPDRAYLLDSIHPNAGDGVILYTEAVLKN